jgi:branched-chain amino acid transport system substrate-binding protein
MSTLKSNRVLSVALLAALMTSGAACTKKEGASGAQSSDKILVGEVGSMTGEQASFGMSTHEGIMLAVEQINVAGVKGKKLEVLSMDDQGKPEEAAQVTTKLITQNGVTALLGEVASSISLAMAPIAQANKVPMITPSSTNPKVTQVGDYIFRVCFIDPFQGTVMAKFATDSLKAKRVAVLRDVKNDYSVGLADFFVQNFKKLGGQIVVDQSYSAGDRDFKSQLTAIRAQSPDAVYVPGYYGDVALIARQARELGIKAPLMGGDGWDAPELKQIGGTAINGSYFSNHYTPEDKSPVVQEFITKYKAKYGKVPDGLAAMGYDAAMILADSMKRATSLDKAAIRDAIAQTKDFQGVTGKITINEHRDAVKSAVVIKVDNGQFKYQTTVAP